MKRIFLILSIVCISACSYTRAIQEDLSGCDHYSGWCKEIRDTAEETFLFAQMAVNTYDDEFQFSLPDEYKLIKNVDNNSIGFAYSLYENNSEDALIISFRGTEGLNFKDWWYGNILGSQNDDGIELFDNLVKSRNGNTKYIVTGHSLGGGIAQEISLKRENVDAYFFNTSPRFSADGFNVENKRISIVENGEILKLLRLAAVEATQTYNSIGCSAGGPVSQHKQVNLAICLTQIAASQSDFARESLRLNDIEFWYSE